MSSIPDPREAQQLRTLFAGNPVIDAIEQLYRQELGPDATVEDVLALLNAGAGLLDGFPLTEREELAVLARFMPVDAEQVYLEEKDAAERRYAQDLAGVVHLRGGNEVREDARKAAGERLKEAYDAAWARFVAATDGAEHGDSGPGGAL